MALWLRPLTTGSSGSPGTSVPQALPGRDPTKPRSRDMGAGRLTLDGERAGTRRYSYLPLLGAALPFNLGSRTCCEAVRGWKTGRSTAVCLGATEGTTLL